MRENVQRKSKCSFKKAVWCFCRIEKIGHQRAGKDLDCMVTWFEQSSMTKSADHPSCLAGVKLDDM